MYDERFDVEYLSVENVELELSIYSCLIFNWFWFLKFNPFGVLELNFFQSLQVYCPNINDVLFVITY